MFYQKAFCTIKKKNHKTKKTKTKQNPEGNVSARVSSESFFCFLVFRFFRFTVASDIFLKKHFPLPAFGIHYFLKKTAFPRIFQAIYFKLLSIKKKNQKNKNNKNKKDKKKNTLRKLWLRHFPQFFLGGFCLFILKTGLFQGAVAFFL